MKIKVCGMRDTQNLKELIALNPDYIGFVFYEKSPRYVVDLIDKNELTKIPSTIEKVGVFVNESTAKIKEFVSEYQLNVLQLHGNETQTQCETLKELGLPIIKAFSVGETFDFTQLEVYKKSCDFFLFDTKGEGHGGNGIVFDWKILENYDNEKPFFLSGGLDATNISTVKELTDLKIHAIDVNSKFEIEPALKDIQLLEKTVFNQFKRNIMNDKKENTGFYDDNNNSIFVGDKLKSEWDYEIIVVKIDNLYAGKLICEEGHSCENIPYALNKGEGHVKVFN